jgi:hypothetical protein
MTSKGLPETERFPGAARLQPGVKSRGYPMVRMNADASGIVWLVFLLAGAVSRLFSAALSPTMLSILVAPWRSWLIRHCLKG